MPRNKYGAVKTTVHGITFDSKAEAEFYLHLLRLQEDGIVEGIQLQKVFKLYAGIKYKADFYVKVNGLWVAVDVKGVETAVFKLKRKLYEADYGPLHVVKAQYRKGIATFIWPFKQG